MADELDDAKLRALYSWIDKIPLSRPKRNLARDFSDGVLFAEVIAAYFPTLVELHNYAPANSAKQKVYNFETLNVKVLKRIGFQLTRKNIEDLVACIPGTAELILHTLQMKMVKYEEEKAAKKGRPNSVPKPTSGAGVTAPSTVSSPEQPNKAISTEPNSAAVEKKSGDKKPQVVVESELLREKEQQIRDLQEQVIILELKVSKLEQLVRFKDNKIQKLTQGH